LTSFYRLLEWSIWDPSATMAGLLIKDLPKDLHRNLRARATANRRSLSSEAITILETVLHARAPLPKEAKAFFSHPSEG
jgi:hypothetical protein